MIRAVCAILLLALAACASPAGSGGGSLTVITNVTLLDGRGGRGIPGATLAINEGRIWGILRDREPVPAGARRIDGGGGFLLPGFIDMHAHLLVPRCEPPTGTSSIFDRAVSERMLGALLDFGITTVRSPGNPTVDGLKLRDALNAGAVRGPRARASAEIIMNPQWDEEQLRSYVRQAMPDRPDYFKVYAGLPPESVAVIVDEAHRHRIPVIGHLGRTSWGEAVQMGIDHLTHAVDWSPLSLRTEHRASYAAAQKAHGAIRARIDWLEHLDPHAPEITAVLDKLATAGISVDPTLVAYDSKFSDPADSRYRRNPHVDVVSEMHADWKACTTITQDWTAGDYRRWAAAWPNMLRLVREMHRRGVLLTTGSDVTNSWVIPGESLHQEFELLSQAGIPEIQILKMTGENAARALGLNDVGVIEPGRRADLVLLRRDPRTDIRNTRSIAWVMQGGSIVTRRAVKMPQAPNLIR